MNGPHARSCQDVCRDLRLLRWFAGILYTFRFDGTAGGLGHSLLKSFSETILCLEILASTMTCSFFFDDETRDG